MMWMARLSLTFAILVLPLAATAQDDEPPAGESAEATVSDGETAGETTEPLPPPPPPSPLKLRTVSVTPSPVGPDTLCRLTVEIENTGDQVATQLGFSVWVGGSELPVYRNHLFMARIDPGATVSLPLYNFWSSETGRPWRGGTALPVQVRLTEARWFEIRTDTEGVEDWNPIGPVPGLPIQVATTVPIRTP